MHALCELKGEGHQAGIQRRLHSERGAQIELWKSDSIWIGRRKRIENSRQQDLS